MTTSNIIVENLKCGGCANSIKTRLQNLTGVFSVNVDNDSARVTVEHNSAINRQSLVKQLALLGYPEENTENSLLTKAKSYVSCAVGRVS